MTKSLRIVLSLAMLCIASAGLAAGKGKPGPVAGTWACVAHGAEPGDIFYTFVLTQEKDKVAGSFFDHSEPSNNADIKDGSFKDKKLELHFDSYGGSVSINGTLAKKGKMSGDWTHSGGGKGTWECTKGAPGEANK